MHQVSLKQKTHDSITPRSKKLRLQKCFDSLKVFFIVTFDSNGNNEYDFNTFFKQKAPLLEEEIHFQLQAKRAIKWYLVTHVILLKITQDGGVSKQ